MASDLGEKHPGKKDEPQISTKDTFWGEGDATWESRAPCPSLGSVVNGYKGPQSETLWDLDVAKSKCHIALPSIRTKTRKSPPHVEKYQQNCSIKATFTGAQSHRGWMVERLTECIMLPQGLRLRWKLGLRFTFQEKGHTTVTLRGKYSCPAP